MNRTGLSELLMKWRLRLILKISEVFGYGVRLFQKRRGENQLLPNTVVAESS
jgi:hypothetical protein